MLGGPAVLEGGWLRACAAALWGSAVVLPRGGRLALWLRGPPAKLCTLPCRWGWLPGRLVLPMRTPGNGPWSGRAHVTAWGLTSGFREPPRVRWPPVRFSRTARGVLGRCGPAWATVRSPGGSGRTGGGRGLGGWMAIWVLAPGRKPVKKGGVWAAWGVAWALGPPFTRKAFRESLWVRGQPDPR